MIICMYDIVALLSITDSREMIGLAWDYRAKWKFVGIELGIDPGTLDAIEANHRNVEERLTDMINKWLRHDEPRPTRGAISAALKSERVSGASGIIIIIYGSFHVKLTRKVDTHHRPIRNWY